MSASPHLLLVDGNALFYRAFHAFPSTFTTPDGRPSGAAYGFTRILLATLKNLSPTHAIVCFDVNDSTVHRKALYAEYKVQRSAMPDDLKTQVPIIWQIVESLDIPRFSQEGLEADDLIGSIAKQTTAEDPNLRVTILSGDQDLIQLVTEQISVLSPAIGFAKQALYTPQSVQEKYGFEPLQMIEYKALAGDSSDNIPGVPGIGDVRAKQLLAQFPTIAKLYSALDSGDVQGFPPSVIAKLREGRALAEISHSLATIVIDAPLTISLDHALVHITNPAPLTALFNELGFKSLIQDLPASHRLVSTVDDIFGEETAAISTTPIPVTSSIADELDAALAPILRAMESTGILIDRAYLQLLQIKFTEELARLTEMVIAEAGQPFNLDSPSQVGNILYEVLGAPTAGVKKGKTGYTTNAETLQSLAADYPVAAGILTYRELAKLQSTYIIPLQELADEYDRIHTTYAPDTSTGRVSSKNPNLQNIPVRTEQGRTIRQAFIAPEGKVLLAIDYSQIELRVAAHLSGDAAMIAAFQSGRDFHTETADRMGVDRRTAKIINFSILYGKGAFGFAQDLHISVEAAKQYIEQYFATYPGLRAYLDSVITAAKKNGYAETMLGRRRYLPDLNGSAFFKRAAAEREATNMPIQGSAAEIIKKAMTLLAPQLQSFSETQLLLTVHDELVLEVPEKDLAAVAGVVKNVMESSYELRVPLICEMKYGKNWNQTQPLSL
jgi:DNA polymerase I-like protein with 3'-5' exonuclease and polymerase domains/5'-3' exonuclease